MTIAAVVFPTGEYAVRRTERGTYDDQGRYVSGEQSTFTIVADVQPVTGELLRNLPAGMVAEETRVVYTAADLRVLSDDQTPDLLEMDGELWRVVRVQTFRALANRKRAWIERLLKTA